MTDALRVKYKLLRGNGEPGSITKQDYSLKGVIQQADDELVEAWWQTFPAAGTN